MTGPQPGVRGPRAAFSFQRAGGGADAAFAGAEAPAGDGKYSGPGCPQAPNSAAAAITAGRVSVRVTTLDVSFIAA